MKLSNLLTALAVVLLVSCSKDDDETSNTTNTIIPNGKSIELGAGQGFVNVNRVDTTQVDSNKLRYAYYLNEISSVSPIFSFEISYDSNSFTDWTGLKGERYLFDAAIRANYSANVELIGTAEESTVTTSSGNGSTYTLTNYSNKPAFNNIISKQAHTEHYPSVYAKSEVVDLEAEELLWIRDSGIQNTNGGAFDYVYLFHVNLNRSTTSDGKVILLDLIYPWLMSEQNSYLVFRIEEGEDYRYGWIRFSVNQGDSKVEVKEVKVEE
jgi:hypothetical protein